MGPVEYRTVGSWIAAPRTAIVAPSHANQPHQARRARRAGPPHHADRGRPRPGARSPLKKIEPRRTVPYRVGRAFTPNTDVLSVSGYAAWMIDEALGATTPLPQLGAAFMRAERQEGINARYFVAHAMLESGWGTSAIARYKRNLFGYNAYDRDPWKHARRFSSHARGVATVAEILRDVLPDARRPPLVRVHDPPRHQPLLRLGYPLGGQGRGPRERHRLPRGHPPRARRAVPPSRPRRPARRGHSGGPRHPVDRRSGRPAPRRAPVRGPLDAARGGRGISRRPRGGPEPRRGGSPGERRVPITSSGSR